MADHQVNGKVARVTETILPGSPGEVMLSVRGGTEAFFAYAADNKEIRIGSRVIVEEYYPPRTVIVSVYN